ALSETAAADTAERRRARDATWRPRREAQAARQRERRSGFLWGIPSLGRRRYAQLRRRLGSAAMRYLPPRAVVLLNSRKRA
ncbi:MAG: hypothetical protein ACRDL7_10155, partial [Gaiellaceae bacterium]